MSNQALLDQITALQLVVSALVVGRNGNPDFADVLAGHLTSEAFKAMPPEEQASVRQSVDRLIGRSLSG
jgi:hypothetical protein